MRKRQTMEIIETFGHYVENPDGKKASVSPPAVKTGWGAQNLKFRYMQDKRLMPQTGILQPDDGYHAVAPSETGRFCYCKYFYTLRNDAGGGITSL